jgi:hypothetical protein
VRRIPDDLCLPGALEVQALLPEPARGVSYVGSQLVDAGALDADLVPVAVVLDRVGRLAARLALGEHARAVLAAAERILDAAKDIDETSLEGGPGGYLVRERPRAGVYDAPLLHRMQKLVAVLPAYDLLHLDFGEIAHPPLGFHAGAWRDLYGAAPSIASYLFYPQPTTMVATTFLEDGPARVEAA